MLPLSPAQLAQVKHLTTETYPYLHPAVRLYLNAQLLEAQSRYDVETWVDQMQATLRWYTEPRAGAPGQS